MLRLALLALALMTTSASAQEGRWQTPIVEGVGRAIHFPGAAMQPDPELTYRVVFDVTRDGEDDEIPLGLSQVARFINSFALHGTDPSALDLVAVLHGKASRVALSDAAYSEHVGGDNPSTALLGRLRQLGVQIYVCGNSLVGSGYSPDEIGPDVELATSAIATLTTLQLRGYSVLSY